MVKTGTGSFAASIQDYVDKTKGNMDEIVRQVTLEVGTRLVYKSPVGNPELWKINQYAAFHAKAVASYNNNLRSNPENLNKAGRLRPGLKIQEPKPPLRIPENLDKAGRFKKGLQNAIIRAPAGYVGGHFRANWQFGETVPSGEVDGIDPSGTDTVSKLEADISQTGSGGVTYIVNNLPYAIPLEYGHSTQAPEGMVRLTTVEFPTIVAEVLQRIGT